MGAGNCRCEPERRGAAGDGVDPRRRLPAGFRRGHVVALGRSSRLAGDVVVVTVNYRLGALGFLTHPELQDDNGVCGNWGVLDLVAALQWVRDEISTFGGDAGNVTLFGESAGGTLVSLLAASPAATGLFHRMIVQSGVPTAAPLDRGAGSPRSSPTLPASNGSATSATFRARRSSPRRSRSRNAGAVGWSSSPPSTVRSSGRRRSTRRSGRGGGDPDDDRHERRRDTPDVGRRSASGRPRHRRPAPAPRQGARRRCRRGDRRGHTRLARSAARRRHPAICGSRSSPTASSASLPSVPPTRTWSTNRGRSCTCSAGGHRCSTVGSAPVTCSRSRSCSESTTGPTSRRSRARDRTPTRSAGR